MKPQKCRGYFSWLLFQGSTETSIPYVKIWWTW